MYSVKVQVRANANNLYINDDIITSNIQQKNQEAIYNTINRALGLFVSVDTIMKVTRYTATKCFTATNTTNYKQIIEENINGCYFRVYVKKENTQER